MAPPSPTPGPRGAFPGAILIAIAAVFFLQAVNVPNAGSLLFVALGIAFATSYVFSTDRRRHVYLVPAGILLGLGVGLLIPALLDAPSRVAAPIFLASLGAGLLAAVVVAPDQRWPLIPAALLFALSLIEVLAHRLFIPDPIRPFVVPTILAAVGIYVLLDRGTKFQ